MLSSISRRAVKAGSRAEIWRRRGGLHLWAGVKVVGMMSPSPLDVSPHAQ